MANDEKLKQRNQRNEWIYGLQRCIETVTQRYHNPRQTEAKAQGSEKEEKRERKKKTLSARKTVMHCACYFNKSTIKICLPIVRILARGSTR